MTLRSIFNIAKNQTFSKLEVRHPPFKCKPLIKLTKTKDNASYNIGSQVQNGTKSKIELGHAWHI